MIGLVEALPSMTEAALRQLMEDHREQAKDGHDRLRKEIEQLKADARSLDEKWERIHHDAVALSRRVDLYQQTPPNIEKMAWSTKQLIMIVAVAFGLGGGMWQLHADMASQVKLEDERNAALEKQVAAALAESRLNGIKTDDLSKQLTTFLLQQQPGKK